MWIYLSYMKVGIWKMCNITLYILQRQKLPLKIIYILNTYRHFEVFQYFVALLQDLLQFAQIVFLLSGTAQTLHNNNSRQIRRINAHSYGNKLQK